MNGDFSGENWSGFNFSNQNLDGANFENSVLIEANFDDDRLFDSNFKNSKLDSSTFNDALADLSDFTGASLIQTRFSNSSLSGSTFNNSTLFHTEFNNADLGGSGWSGARFLSTNFSGANLQGAYFANSDLSNVNFTDANMTGVTIADSSVANNAGSRIYNIIGSPEVEQVLNLSIVRKDPDGYNNNYEPTYQWQITNGGYWWVDITGETSSTYIIKEEDLGKIIRASVTYQDGENFIQTVQSEPITAGLLLTEKEAASAAVGQEQHYKLRIQQQMELHHQLTTQ